MTVDRICIIGAGSSGLVCAKTFKEHGLPFDCFEMGSSVGGNWRYGNDNGRSAAYDSLHVDTSKERMAFSDFPMPAHYPNYIHHSQVLEYLEGYARHFGLLPFIRFGSEVEQVAPEPDGAWSVTTRRVESGERRTDAYRAVLVCNGHHWDPKLPEFPGEFTGNCFHSREYRSPRQFEGKRVLVVGIGNSGADIACECARVARKTYLSTRRSAHIVPRYILGRPADSWVTPVGSRLPVWLQRAFYSLLLRVSRGDQARRGVPKPAHKLLSAHPTMSADLLDLTTDGRIEVRPDIAELRGDRVRFVDGAEVPVDTLVYATGYRISFPFLDPAIIDSRENRVDLYRHVVLPDRSGLFFIGLIQPIGAIMPLAEIQARWVVGMVTGEFGFPDVVTMRRAIAKERERQRRCYVDSSRHTIEVDFFAYKRLLLREMRQHLFSGDPVRLVRNAG